MVEWVEVSFLCQNPIPTSAQSKICRQNYFSKCIYSIVCSVAWFIIDASLCVNILPIWSQVLSILMNTFTETPIGSCQQSPYACTRKYFAQNLLRLNCRVWYHKFWFIDRFFCYLGGGGGYGSSGGSGGGGGEFLVPKNGFQQTKFKNLPKKQFFKKVILQHVSSCLILFVEILFSHWNQVFSN